MNLAQVRGVCLESRPGELVVGVGAEHSYVGYLVHVPARAPYDQWIEGERIGLQLYTHVTESSIDLFGFQNTFEKEVFLTLLQVNTVGPKVAMGLLSMASAERIAQAVQEEDHDFLESLPRVGKKLAERILVEIRDRVQKKLASGAWRLESHAALGSAPAVAKPAHGLKDAQQALMGLGFRESDVVTALDQVLRALGDTPVPSVEGLIKAGLKQLHG